MVDNIHTQNIPANREMPVYEQLKDCEERIRGVVTQFVGSDRNAPARKMRNGNSRETDGTIIQFTFRTDEVENLEAITLEQLETIADKLDYFSLRLSLVTPFLIDVNNTNKEVSKLTAEYLSPDYYSQPHLTVNKCRMHAPGVTEGVKVSLYFLLIGPSV